MSTCFKAAAHTGWFDPRKTRCEHIGFGVVLGEDRYVHKTSVIMPFRLRGHRFPPSLLAQYVFFVVLLMDIGLSLGFHQRNFFCYITYSPKL